MPPSNYPNGFPNGLINQGLPVLNTYSGNVFWVDSATGGNGNPGTYLKPFATLDYAIGRCTANHGDLIMIKPNHAETITGIGGITFDVAGITVKGLGNYNQRPRFLMDGATTVTAVVSAADVTIENLVFAGGHNGIATCFDVDAVGFTSIGIEFEDNTANEHFLIAYTVGSTTDNTCDGLTIIDGKWYTPDAGPTAFISLTGDTDRATIVGNKVIADAASIQLLLHAAGDDLQGLVFTHNTIITALTTGDILIDNNQSDNTGYAAYNLAGHHDTDAPVIIDCDGIRQFENYSASEDTSSGGLRPAVDDFT